jgi:hypothetical protein
MLEKMLEYLHWVKGDTRRSSRSGAGPVRALISESLISLASSLLLNKGSERIGVRIPRA